MIETVFEVRRSRPHAAVQAVFAALLLALAVGNLGNIYTSDEVERGPVFAALLFTVLIAFYLWQSIAHYRDRGPQVVVRSDGLMIPSALPEPIPWPRIWRVEHAGGFSGRWRIDVDVDPEILKRMRLGQRYLGDSIVARKGIGGNGFSIHTNIYDRKAAELAAAIRRYWPPADADDKD
jgi:hypothetical protein